MAVYFKCVPVSVMVSIIVHVIFALTDHLRTYNVCLPVQVLSFVPRVVSVWDCYKLFQSSVLILLADQIVTLSLH